MFETLATKHDRIWPKEQWPAMRLSNGLNVGSSGGHGPIGYTVEAINPGTSVAFRFDKPKGFEGSHWFEVSSLGDSQTEMKHTIDMNAKGIGLLTWTFAIRWLHDALVEDAFDKVENQFSNQSKKTSWNLWVKTLRWALK